MILSILRLKWIPYHILFWYVAGIIDLWVGGWSTTHGWFPRGIWNIITGFLTLGCAQLCQCDTGWVIGRCHFENHVLDIIAQFMKNYVSRIQVDTVPCMSM
jgi:hypothetical protein